MIRMLLTTTALATLLSTGVMAQDAPANTTEAPANTTAAPANTTAAPAAGTETPAAPANETAAPANTTEAPANETAAPANGTAAPANETAAPANETAAPANETAAPDNTTMAPANETAAPADAAPADAAPADGAVAPPAEMMAESFYSAAEGDNIASRVLGSTVYTTAGDDAETIGDINDMVIGSDGSVAAAVIGVGGFLGMGEKNVAVKFDQLEWTQAADGSWRYVLPTTADALNAAPDFVFETEDDAAAAEQQEEMEQEADQAAEDDQGAAVVDQGAANSDNAAAQTTEMAPAVPVETAPAEGQAAPANDAAAGDAAAPGAIDRSTLRDMDPAAMTAEDLTGTAVYGVNDEQIGDIGDFVLNAEGGIDAVIVDVGGFLGLGQKPVAVAFENLRFSVDENNNRYLFLNTTQEQLEGQPEFNKDTYSTERDAQRMVTNP